MRWWSSTASGSPRPPGPGSDLATVLSADELVIGGDSLRLRARAGVSCSRDDSLCSIDVLRSMVERHPGSRGVRKARAAVELIRVGADSPPETRLRLALVRAGLAEPVLNHVVRGDDPWGGGLSGPAGPTPPTRSGGSRSSTKGRTITAKTSICATSGGPILRRATAGLRCGCPGWTLQASIRRRSARSAAALESRGLARELTVRGNVFAANTAAKCALGGAAAGAGSARARVLQARVTGDTAPAQEWLGWFLADEVHSRVNPARRRNSL